MQCPVCPHELKEVDYEGVRIHACDGCGGEFTGPAQITQIVNTRKERFDGLDTGADLDLKPTFGVPEAETRRTLQCPACRCAMEVCNYCGDTGVYVDRCNKCGGVWLDCEELETVQILIERWADSASEQIQAIAGELEMARRRAASSTDNTFAGSRFAFVNALFNRFLDAA